MTKTDANSQEPVTTDKFVGRLVQDNLKECFALIALHSYAMGAIYLMSFWGYFNIPIFSYIGSSEVIGLAFYPILKAWVTCGVGFFTFSTRFWSDSSGDGTVSGDVSPWFFWLVVLVFIGGAVAAREFEIIAVVALMRLLVEVFWKLRTRLIHEDSNCEQSRRLVYLAIAIVWFVILPPAWAWQQGASDARHLLNAKTYMRYKSCLPEERYIGMAGGYRFFWNRRSEEVREVRSDVLDEWSFVMIHSKDK
jgi:hypothetical protein